MNYGGGPLLTGNVNIYYIYYGTGFATSDKNYLENLVSGISSHPYFESEMTFYSTSGSTKNYIQGPVTYVKGVDDNYSHGKSLADADIQTIVTDHIQSGDFPLDTNAVYYVLTASDVQETSGFCSQYCGWHNNFAYQGKDIKFAFIGNPANCLAGCSPDNVNTSPNGNPGVDAMASIITHELMEAMSDPDPSSGWTDSAGNENADKCAYVYGKELVDKATNSKYNTQIGNYKYLIQQNWKLDINTCFNHPVTGGTPPSSIASNPISSTSAAPVTSTSAAPVTSTSSAPPVSSSASAACVKGTTQCLAKDGTSPYYNECSKTGTWVKKSCKSTGYSYCYQYNAKDVYCD
jgi:hypothetical protein